MRLYVVPLASHCRTWPDARRDSAAVASPGEASGQGAPMLQLPSCSRALMPAIRTRMPSVHRSVSPSVMLATVQVKPPNDPSWLDSAVVRCCARSMLDRRSDAKSAEIISL